MIEPEGLVLVISCPSRRFHREGCRTLCRAHRTHLDGLAGASPAAALSLSAPVPLAQLRPAAAETPPGFTRIRHYTNKSGLDAIAREGVIRAHDRGRVFAQDAREPVLSPREAEARYRIAKGHGNHYVETDVKSGRVVPEQNERKQKELTIRGDVELLNAVATCR